MGENLFDKGIKIAPRLTRYPLKCIIRLRIGCERIIRFEGQSLGLALYFSIMIKCINEIAPQIAHHIDHISKSLYVLWLVNPM